MSFSLGFLGERLKRILTLRGFLAAPSAMTLSGLGVTAASFLFDQSAPELVAAYGMAPDVGRTVLGTLAGAAMTMLGLVYSLTLVVFTLAAGSIAPRLLERFSGSAIVQVAIGSLGALFLHSLVALGLSTGGPVLAPVVAAVAMALTAVLLLILFVDRVSKRITIDEEIAAIADQMDARVARVAAGWSRVSRAELVLPGGEGAEICAAESGYVDMIAMKALADCAARRGGVVDFSVSPGDHVLKGEVIGRAIGGDEKALAEDACAAVSFGPRRTSEGDLLFSVSLILEIALRALSPGVNDSFTAITCIDRLTASFAKAAEHGLNPGVICDDEGAARVVAPGTGVEDLVRFAFAPIRQVSRDNLLVINAAVSALTRLAPRLEGAGREEAERQIALFIKEAEAGGALEADLDALRAQVEDVKAV